MANLEWQTYILDLKALCSAAVSKVHGAECAAPQGSID